MLVRVKATVLPGGAIGANLPTYNEVITLHDQGIVYALIPDADHPSLHEHPSARFEHTGHGDALIELDSDGHEQWHVHLDKRYQERKGQFRPEVA